MIRTQIQLPDDLYRRAKAFAASREMSLAEITRRGLEILLSRHPEPGPPESRWVLPRVDGGGVRLPMGKLHDVAAEEEESRARKST